MREYGNMLRRIAMGMLQNPAGRTVAHGFKTVDGHLRDCNAALLPPRGSREATGHSCQRQRGRARRRDWRRLDVKCPCMRGNLQLHWSQTQRLEHSVRTDDRVSTTSLLPNSVCFHTWQQAGPQHAGRRVLLCHACSEFPRRHGWAAAASRDHNGRTDRTPQL